MKKLLIIPFLLIISSMPFAYAHPVIANSDPVQSSSVSAGVNQIVIHYSEAIEIEFSAIKVFDSSGNQIDNKDTKYIGSESTLAVTTPPLKDGIYTVTSKVLSKIDGHLVDEAFVFGVGDVSVPPPKPRDMTESTYFPEAGARLPGIIGQVIVLGSVISSVIIWGTMRKKRFIKDNLSELQKFYQAKFSSIIGIGLFLVFASNILMLVVQTLRLQTSASMVLQTSFGSIWIARMAITVVLLAAWFMIESKSNVSNKKQILLLGLSLMLISTTTIIGHGAASEQIPAIIVDYTHSLIASVWIGGVIFFGFVLLPALSKLDGNKKEIGALLAIPRFSSMIVISLGVLIITGPALLWLLEDDVVLLSQSSYGFLIMAKIGVASIMAALGGYNQFKLQKSAEKDIKSDTINIHRKLGRSLKTEAVLGVILLGLVALLTNSSLPTSQAQQIQQVTYGFQTSEFSENARFDINIDPFASGSNTIVISVFDSDGNPLADMDDLMLKISNPQRNIAPINIPISKISEKQNEYQGNLAFGFSGNWNIEIEAKRKDHANESIGFSVVVKPHVSELKTQITEYDVPAKDAGILYPTYDGSDTIWISDSSQPRLWKFSLESKQFKPYTFEGGKTTVFLKLASDGLVWFTDTPDSKIGYFDPVTEKFQIISLPTKSIPISLETDLEGNVWIALVDQNMLLKYDPVTGQFEEHEIPTRSSGPAALARDAGGNIWFAEAQGGKIGVIEPQSGKIREFAPDGLLGEPFALFIDSEQNVWISEHVGLNIVKFNPLLETFEKIPVVDPQAAPFGMTSDKFGNIWLAQHTVDKLGVYDPTRNEFSEVNIPTKTSFTQFVTSDKDGNVWFVEQRGNKLGTVVISEVPNQRTMQEQPTISLRYSEIAAPLMTVGIIATSLFFVKSVRDKRRLDALIE
ncbi:virginiamycin B lyase family protein [Candidatus Nitrosotenuis sp. DW1]|uniref:virginiamycin B lyase family protein n=1 Tax=Candidatus Nitrosotenuis sp. DW1 TaxID=2259672 RepID=UPI0015CAEF57|nr:CopD family protein [Candidatus Nitrosotenuis sp. DW1]QLH08209.1 copper resistance protein CopD [Candidatus Nitrosotenuis sp. DW1]